MKTIALLALGALLVGCVAPGPAGQKGANDFEQIRQGFIVAWGPEKNWSPQQEAIFLNAINREYDEKVASLDARTTPAARPVNVSQQVAYQPYTYRQFTATKPNPFATTHMSPDGNGGYVVTNSDGTTQHIVSDGRGGWIVRNY